ncbi:MAG: tRNA pseudouridine(55) synthase TruB [Acidobacteriota bacterium]|nr:tRNA pseudouridine(55) synthase TruB [Acidobacteriota bacterium]
MDGLILVNKPQGLTSHDIVIKIRKLFNIQKVGHFGTLDPLATGLLVVSVGKATRLSQFYVKQNKTYQGQIRLGYSTDTYDSLGKRTSEIIELYPERNILISEMKKFEGETDQLPPLYSAKKYKGKPLYVYARQKKVIKLKSRKVFIYFFRLKNYQSPVIDFEVKCSSGTYIRSLAHDLGQNLGCRAHLIQLKRTHVGNFSVENSFTLEEIYELVQEEKIDSFLLPLEILLPEFPKIILKDSGSILAKKGNLISSDEILKFFPGEQSPASKILKYEKERIFKLFTKDGKLIAFARKTPEKDLFHPFFVIDSVDEQKIKSKK